MASLGPVTRLQRSEGILLKDYSCQADWPRAASSGQIQRRLPDHVTIPAHRRTDLRLAIRRVEQIDLHPELDRLYGPD